MERTGIFAASFDLIVPDQDFRFTKYFPMSNVGTGLSAIGKAPALASRKFLLVGPVVKAYRAFCR